MPSRRTLMAVAAGMPLLRSAWAQSWPSRPIRFVVPSAPGGGADIICRAFADAMRPSFPRGLIVDNRPGGGSTIGMGEIARAAPDGHVIGYANIVTLAINQALLPSEPYDVERDFASVAMLGFTQNALVTRPDLGAKSVAELIALAKRKPGELTFASPGNGTSGHLAMELFKWMTGTDMVHVPYRGAAQSIQDVLAGRVDMTLDNLVSVLPHVREGRVPMLAVSGSSRSPQAPEVPTIAEAGVPGYEAKSWGGIVVPAATPKEVIEQLNRTVNDAIESPTLKVRLTSLAWESAPGSSSALFDLARQERPRWAEVVRRSGAKAD